MYIINNICYLKEMLLLEMSSQIEIHLPTLTGSLLWNIGVHQANNGSVGGTEQKIHHLTHTWFMIEVSFYGSVCWTCSRQEIRPLHMLHKDIHVVDYSVQKG